MPDFLAAAHPQPPGESVDLLLPPDLLHQSHLQQQVHVSLVYVPSFNALNHVSLQT